MQVVDRNGRLKVEITSIVDDLSIGVTTISGGTNGRALYDNAGVLGEIAGTSAQYIAGDGTLITFPTALPPSGTAGGDLTGTYPNPTVHKIHGIDMQNGTPSADDVWVYGGSPAKWQHQHLNASQVNNDSSVTGTSVKLALNHLDSTKVPTSRTLTINGTTQDLSADRTFTISTGITIGTTAITSGVVGRVLFEGTGNVVSESANLFWDNTNRRLGIGTSSPDSEIDIKGNINGAVAFSVNNTNSGSMNESAFLIGQSPRIAPFSALYFSYFGSGYTASGFRLPSSAVIIAGGGASNGMAFVVDNGSGPIRFSTNSNNERLRITNTGNVLINTTTDAGYKLDVNGTARVSNDLTIGSNRYLKAFRWTNDDVTRALQIEGNSNFNVDAVNIISWNNNLLNNTKNILNIGLSSTVSTQSSGSTDFFNVLNIPITYNFTGGIHTVKGIYYNPTLTAMVGTTHYAFHSTSGRIRFEGLPTSSAGLSAGDIWNDAGTLKIV